MSDDPIIAELNRKHALVSEGGKVTIITERFDSSLRRNVLDRSSAADFRLLYKNRQTWIGKRHINYADYWLEHAERRQYREIVFDPDPNREQDVDVYNLWKGFQVTGVKGDWDIFRNHLLEVGANGDQEMFDYIVKWCARLVQFPHISAQTAIVWRGPQGAGKGMIARTLGKIVGQHYIQISNTKHLVGHFNQHLQDALVVFSDEAFWAGDRASEGALKALITEPTIVIERKGRDVIVTPNRVHLVMATNNEWAVPMAFDDRRFAIVDVPDSRVGQSNYFRDMEHCMSNGGLKAFMWELENAYADTIPHPPKNGWSANAAVAQKLLTATKTQQWWYQKLEAGAMFEDTEWMVEVSRAALYEDYLKAMEKVKEQRRSMEMFLASALRSMVPWLRTTRKRDGTGIKRYWELPTLAECRAHFEKLIHTPNLFSADQDEVE